MMNTITQYIHRPNNTELGKTGTHDNYILAVTQVKDNMADFMPPGSEIEFQDMSSELKWRLKSAQGREFRVNQLGVLYRKYEVEFGDEVILHKQTSEDSQKYYIGVKKVNAIGLSRLKQNHAFEVINRERSNIIIPILGNVDIDVNYKGEKRKLRIQYLEARRKRSDSQETTLMYNIYIDGVKHNQSLLLFTDDRGNKIKDYEKYEYHKITWEE